MRVLAKIGLLGPALLTWLSSGCGGTAATSGGASDLSDLGSSASNAAGSVPEGGGCPDAAAAPFAAPREAGLPQCIGLGGDPCPVPDAGTPDPANWGCYSDRDCAVFRDFPFCDRNSCAGAQRALTCVAGAMAQGGFPNPDVSHSYDGTNGTFADHCDASGNLVDYWCEMMSVSSCAGSNGGSSGICSEGEVYTGRVVPLPQIVDCAGSCGAARCDGRCPVQADQVTFVEAGAGDAEIVHNDSDGRTYNCSGTSAGPGTAFDCANIPAGQTGYLYAVGGGTYPFCTGATVFAISVVLDGVPTPPGSATCNFSCTMHPTSKCGT